MSIQDTLEALWDRYIESEPDQSVQLAQARAIRDSFIQEACRIAEELGVNQDHPC